MEVEELKLQQREEGVSSSVVGEVKTKNFLTSDFNSTDFCLYVNHALKADPSLPTRTMVWYSLVWERAVFNTIFLI